MPSGELSILADYLTLLQSNVWGHITTSPTVLGFLRYLSGRSDAVVVRGPLCRSKAGTSPSKLDDEEEHVEIVDGGDFMPQKAIIITL
jgi:hypothetical protein